MNMTWDKFDTVWDPKHRAALYLHDALEKNTNANFSFFWMFSSTAVYGNPGQVNYSASNSYMDALCRHRRATGRPACAMQWGAWGEVGMAANLDAATIKRFNAGPSPPFLTAEGLKGLEAGLRTGLPGFAVFKSNAELQMTGLKACEDVKACYFRNFASLMMPAAASLSLDRFHAYTIFRVICDGLSPSEANMERRYYKHFIESAVEDGLDSSWW